MIFFDNFPFAYISWYIPVQLIRDKITFDVENVDFILSPSWSVYILHDLMLLPRKEELPLNFLAHKNLYTLLKKCWTECTIFWCVLISISTSLHCPYQLALSHCLILIISPNSYHFFYMIQFSYICFLSLQLINKIKHFGTS